MTVVDWGTVPAWVAALLTSSGVAWGAWTFRMSRHDRLREHSEKILFRRTQLEPRRDENGMRYRAFVRNVSDLPFVAISVVFRESGDYDEVAIPSLEPGEESLVESKVMEVRAHRRGKIWWEHPLRSETHLVLVDLGGYLWLRTVDGRTIPAPRVDRLSG